MKKSKKLVVFFLTVILMSSSMILASSAAYLGCGTSGDNQQTFWITGSSTQGGQCFAGLSGTQAKALLGCLNQFAGTNTSSDFASAAEAAEQTPVCAPSEVENEIQTRTQVETPSDCDVAAAPVETKTAAAETEATDNTDSACAAAVPATCAPDTSAGQAQTFCGTDRLFAYLSRIFTSCGVDPLRFDICLPEDKANTSAAAPAENTETSAPAEISNAQPSQPASDSSAEPSAAQPADNLSFEQQVAALVNEQRAIYGLSPLTLNEELSAAARAKSQDMHDNGYFAHTSPTYGSPFDMLRAFGISFSSAGENIAMGYATPEAVMDAWMNSSGHRANILNASYAQIGVGYVADGNYWTQEFIG